MISSGVSAATRKGLGVVLGRRGALSVMGGGQIRAIAATRSASTTTATSRIMLPDDSNPAGNVHGGVILKMLEGEILSIRFLVEI